MYIQTKRDSCSSTISVDNIMDFKFEMTPALEKMASQLIFNPEVLSDDDRFYLGTSYQLNAHDVMCGRGKGSLNNLGNKSFRAVIVEHMDTYFRKSRTDKGGTVENIIDIIRSRGGHFLKQDEKTKEWYDIGDEAAASKVGHAFRDAKSNRAADKKQKKRKSLDKIRELKRDDMQELLRSLSDSDLFNTRHRAEEDMLDLDVDPSSLFSVDVSLFGDL